MASNKIDWRKIVAEFDEFDEFDGFSTQFCKDKNITKGQLFYYKKKFKDEGTVFCPINIKDDKKEIHENKSLSVSQNIVSIDFKNAKISMPASETALITAIIRELAELC